MSEQVLASGGAVSVRRTEPSRAWGWWSASFLLVVLLTVATWWLNRAIPAWNKQLRVIEFPVYAVLLGLLASGVLSVLGVRERLAAYFRTEFFLKTGLVLLGATINLTEIVAFGAKGLVQAVILISSVFLFTWFVARWLGLEEKLRALLSASVAICGVSAAIAAAGSVLAKKEQLAYVTGLVILFALPLMFLQPGVAVWLARAARNFCWFFVRSRSLPESAYRVRTKARACSPFRVCGPASKFAPDLVSFIPPLGISISTPPTESTMLAKPAKPIST